MTKRTRRRCIRPVPVSSYVCGIVLLLVLMGAYVAYIHEYYSCKETVCHESTTR